MQTPTRHKRTKTALLVGVAALFVIGDPTDSGSLLPDTRDAHAVIGRPLTPMSYAGVARRTTRRAYYGGAAGGYYGGYGAPRYYAAPPAVPTTAVVTSLPAGCAQVVSGGVHYQCGAAQYAPYYNGATVVYRPY